MSVDGIVIALIVVLLAFGVLALAILISQAIHDYRSMRGDDQY